MPDETPPPSVEDAKAATSAPIGISSTHIFIVAMAAILSFDGIAAWCLWHTPDASDRATVLQAAIGMANLAFGYFLGSSAGARNKAGTP